MWYQNFILALAKNNAIFVSLNIYDQPNNKGTKNSTCRRRPSFFSYTFNIHEVLINIGPVFINLSLFSAAPAFCGVVHERRQPKGTF